MAAIIFDMDDTLLATAALWRRAEERMLASVGEKWTPDLARHYKGMNALDVAATAYRILHPAGVSVAEFQDAMRSALLEEFRAELPTPMPGAADCVKRMAAKAKAAVASGSPLPAVESCLAQLGVADCLAAILSSESVPRGKPSPDVFLAAAEKLGAPPAQCCVFEDSVVGVEAAINAGMACIAVPSGDDAARAQIAQLGAHVFASLQDVRWEDVERALKRRSRRSISDDLFFQPFFR